MAIIIAKYTYFHTYKLGLFKKSRFREGVDSKSFFFLMYTTIVTTTVFGQNQLHKGLLYNVTNCFVRWFVVERRSGLRRGRLMRRRGFELRRIPNTLLPPAPR